MGTWALECKNWAICQNQNNVEVWIFFRGACITDVKYISDFSQESEVMIVFT